LFYFILFFEKMTLKTPLEVSNAIKKLSASDQGKVICFKFPRDVKSETILVSNSYLVFESFLPLLV